MPVQKMAATFTAAERGITPSGVSTETGDTSWSRSPTFRFMRSAKRRPTITVKSSPKPLSVPQSIGLSSSALQSAR